MKIYLILPFLFLGLYLHGNGQSDNNSLPSELHEPGRNIWISWVEDLGYSWRINPNGLTGNPFQYIQNLYPIDSISLADYMLGKCEHNMFIFTFEDKLRIQTYDGDIKKVIKTEYCNYERKPYHEPVYWFDFDDYGFLVGLEGEEEYFHKLTISMEGIPVLRSDPKEHIWMAKANKNLMTCENEAVEFNLGPYTEEKMKEFVSDIWLNNREGNMEQTMIQLFTFGDSLRIQTYDVLERKVVKTEFYNYEPIENKVNSFWVYLPDGKARLSGYSIYAAYFKLSMKCE